MPSRNYSRAAVIGSLFLLLPFAHAGAQETDDDDAERCVTLNQIRSTEVVDDRNVLFYMRGDRVYLNRLPRACPGLRQERSFLYRTTMPRLCDLDVITVIYDQGFGFTPGASCGLGRFHPMTKDEAEVMKEQISGKAPEAKPVPPAKPEDVSEPR